MPDAQPLVELVSAGCNMLQHMSAEPLQCLSLPREKLPFIEPEKGAGSLVVEIHVSNLFDATHNELSLPYQSSPNSEFEPPSSSITELVTRALNYGYREMEPFWSTCVTNH